MKPSFSIALTLQLLLIAAPKLQAQDLLTLRGQVVDEETKHPLPGAHVFLIGSPKNAVTNLAGEFSMVGVPEGGQTLIVRHVGYAETSLSLDLSAQSSDLGIIEIRVSELQMGEIVVSATRESQFRNDVSASIGSIDESLIQRLNPAHPSQIAGRIPGVWINATEGEGHLTAIRQPLSTLAHYLYLENGIPTRSTGFFNHNALFEVNVPQAGGVEIIKGPGTALYGSDAIGGVINVLTAPLPSEAMVGATVEGGSFGFKRLLLSGATRRGRDGFRMDINITDSDGWRNDTEYARQSLNLTWERTAGDRIKLKTVAALSNVDQHPAGIAAISEEDYLQDARLHYTPVSFRTVKSVRISTAIERFGNHSLLSVTPFFRYSAMELLPNWALSFDPATWETENYSVGMQLKLQRDFGKWRSRIVSGVDVDMSPGSRQEDELIPTREGKIFVEYEEAGAQYDYDVTYRQASPFVHAEFSPVPAFRITTGLRLDLSGYDYTNNLSEVQTGSHRRPSSDVKSYTHFSPKLGFTYDLQENVNVFASYRHAFRVPSERQMFRQGRSIDSIGLDPVKVDSYELGLRSRLTDDIRVEATAYSMTKKNDIVTFNFEDGSRGSVNTGETLHQGLETGLQIDLPAGLEISSSFTYARHTYEQWVTQLGNDRSGNEMEVAPRVILNSAVSYTVEVLEGLDLGIEHSRIGGYWMDAGNTSKYDGHDVFNLRASLGVNSSWRVLARIGNLTDTLYAERATYNAFRGDEFAPGAPRRFNLALKYTM